MPRLMVMRHAKSDWNSSGSDHERPLNSRGVRQAKAMGIALAQMGEIPDAILSSDAHRAATTVKLALEAGSWTSSVDYLPQLYTTTAAKTCEIVKGAPNVDRLMVVGHMPTWSDLVEQLTGGRVDVKTATVIGIDVPGSGWGLLGDAPASIAYVLHPDMFLDD